MATLPRGPRAVQLFPPELVDPLADDDSPGLGPIPLDGEGPAPMFPPLPFPEWIDSVASWLRSRELDDHVWLAARISEIAAEARELGAISPAEFEARAAFAAIARDGTEGGERVYRCD